jgi:hypothetical protein
MTSRLERRQRECTNAQWREASPAIQASTAQEAGATEAEIFDTASKFVITF